MNRRALTPAEKMTTAERMDVIRRFRTLALANEGFPYGALDVGAMRVIVDTIDDYDGEWPDPDAAYERHLESNERVWWEEEQDRQRTLYTDPIWGIAPTNA